MQWDFCNTGLSQHSFSLLEIVSLFSHIYLARSACQQDKNCSSLMDNATCSPQTFILYAYQFYCVLRSYKTKVHNMYSTWTYSQSMLLITKAFPFKKSSQYSGTRDSSITIWTQITQKLVRPCLNNYAIHSGNLSYSE
jgi:hypothetical protein